MADEIFNNIKKGMDEYNDELVKESIESSIKENLNPFDTIEVLTKSINEIGERFGKGELFLPDLMLAAKTMKAGMDILEKEIKNKGLEKKSIGKIVIGTVYGDLHSIGKDMVSTLLGANGFDVIDLGVNVESKKVYRSNREI